MSQLPVVTELEPGVGSTSEELVFEDVSYAIFPDDAFAADSFIVMGRERVWYLPKGEQTYAEVVDLKDEKWNPAVALRRMSSRVTVLRLDKQLKFNKSRRKSCRSIRTWSLRPRDRTRRVFKRRLTKRKIGQRTDFN